MSEPGAPELDPNDRPVVAGPHYAAPEWQRFGWQTTPHTATRQADVVIVGGGMSGCAAAIAAARRGISVLVVEPRHMLGGQAAVSGVSTMDLSDKWGRQLDHHGLWAEFVARLRSLYDEIGRPLDVARYRAHSIAPNASAVDRVWSEWLAALDIDVLRHTEVVSAQIDDSSARLDTSAGLIVAKLAIDATEGGELLAAAGEPFRLGRSHWDGAEFSVPPAEVRLQHMTQVAVIRRYDEGLPDALRMTAPPPGYERYRRVVSSHYPFGPPAIREKAEHPNGFAGYRAVPDISGGPLYTGQQWQRITRTALNYGNDCPVRASYFTEPEARQRFEAEAINRTLSIIWYLQHELGQPWGVVTDEGFGDGPHRRDFGFAADTPDFVRHFPPLPYLRESRRLVGRETLTGQRIFRRRYTIAAWDTACVAVGHYAADLHGGRSEEDFELHLGERPTDKWIKWAEGPFSIPLGTLLPASGRALFAAEKNISASRMASSAARVHPAVVAIGEAAGTVAALAIRAGVAPQTVPTLAVQWSLVDGGAAITPLAIRGVLPGDERYPAATMAVAHGLVDWTPGRPDLENARLVTDVGRATRLGEALRAEFSDWLPEVQADGAQLPSDSA